MNNLNKCTAEILTKFITDNITFTEVPNKYDVGTLRNIIVDVVVPKSIFDIDTLDTPIIYKLMNMLGASTKHLSNINVSYNEDETVTSTTFTIAGVVKTSYNNKNFKSLTFRDIPELEKCCNDLNHKLDTQRDEDIVNDVVVYIPIPMLEHSSDSVISIFAGARA